MTDQEREAITDPCPPPEAEPFDPDGCRVSLRIGLVEHQGEWISTKVKGKPGGVLVAETKVYPWTFAELVDLGAELRIVHEVELDDSDLVDNEPRDTLPCEPGFDLVFDNTSELDTVAPVDLTDAAEDLVEESGIRCSTPRPEYDQAVGCDVVVPRAPRVPRF